MAKEKLPFELDKPNANTPVTQAECVGYGENGNVKEELDKINGSFSKQSTQSEEQAIIYETDGGVQVGKIDANGADFTNLKRGGQQVARMSDLPTVPTLDTSIGNSPSNSHTPSTKAVKNYVDDNIPEVPDYPIETETIQSEAEEVIFGNNAGTQQYVKVSSEGIRAVAYNDMQGNNVIPVKDASIGENPSATNVPTTKAVADYVNEHGVGDLPVSGEPIASEVEKIVFGSNDESQIFVEMDSTGIKAKAFFDLEGNPIGGNGNIQFDFINGVMKVGNYMFKLIPYTGTANFN